MRGRETICEEYYFGLIERNELKREVVVDVALTADILNAVITMEKDLFL